MFKRGQGCYNKNRKRNSPDRMWIRYEKTR